MKPPEYKSLSGTRGKAELCFHWETKVWEMGMATSGFVKPKVCEVQQALEGLGPAAGAGIEVLIVAFH